ncbi:MAG: YraN family protein [Paramuribaculum sp.]|nr:YraN family protein [Paramuribaculum sp.]MDE7236540.1 YraN family protein [Paramuribaculum sp.]
MARHNRLGAEGERIAAEYLIARGYTIHKQDERMASRGEIDIIAFKDEEVVFVEVKTRTAPDTDPMEVFGDRRRARMCSAADSFIRNMDLRQSPRFDIIIVNMLPDGTHTVSHYPDAFFPQLGRGYR